MRGDSLRIRLGQALSVKYPGYLTLDEVSDICKEYRKKLSNAERRFRNDKKAKGSTVIAEKIKNNKGAIIGYRWIPPGDRKIDMPPMKRKNDEFDDLNNKLKELLKKIRLGFDTYKIIDEIQRAIKAKYPETKERVLNEYKDQFI